MDLDHDAFDNEDLPPLMGDDMFTEDDGRFNE